MLRSSCGSRRTSTTFCSSTLAKLWSGSRRTPIGTNLCLRKKQWSMASWTKYWSACPPRSSRPNRSPRGKNSHGSNTDSTRKQSAIHKNEHEETEGTEEGIIVLALLVSSVSPVLVSLLFRVSSVLHQWLTSF